MTRRDLVVVGLALALACKKKQMEQAPPIAATPADAAIPADGPLELRPLAPARDGVAFLLDAEMIARLDHEGWKTFEMRGVSHIVEGLDGTPIAYGSSVWRLVDDKLIEVPGTPRPTHVAGGADRSVWALADGKLWQAEAEKFVAVAPPGDDPLRGLQIARDGSVWIHTIDRTYVREGTGWKAVSVPDVTGSMADIEELASHPRGDLYVVTTVGLYRRAAAAWQRLVLNARANLAKFIAGPDGRYVATEWDGTAHIGDERGLVTTLTLDRELRPSAFDDRGRLWLIGDRGIQVLHAGKVVRFWRTDELPIQRPQRLTVLRGGPAIGAGERAGGTITGKVEGSAAGMIVMGCVGGGGPGLDYNEPCSGDDTTRRTTTKAGGRFTLSKVALAPMNFWVKRGDWWRGTKRVECCAKLSPDGTADIGVLQLD